MNQDARFRVRLLKVIGSARRTGGFALVVTLMLMILVTLLAVGLLSMSAVTLRSSSNDMKLSVARHNARLGLMLAIGEIQKQLGPDQKITAGSSILNPDGSAGTAVKHPHLTGVWNSRQETLADPPDYNPAKGFVEWLVSSSNPGGYADQTSVRNIDFPKTGSFDQPILMASAHGSDPTYAGRVEIESNLPGIRSGLAWWVGDENRKGFTNPVDSLARTPERQTVPELLATAGTPGAYGMEILDSKYPANTETIDKVLSHEQLSLASSAGPAARNWFHDLSPHSQGLLTNVVKGGWRRDLSLFLEQTGLPFPWLGQRVPNAIGPNGKYALSTRAPAAFPYDPDSGYDVLSWKSLYNFYHYKDRIAMSGGRPFLKTVYDNASNSAGNDLTNPLWNRGVLRPSPVLVRSQVFISIGSIAAGGGLYGLRFYAYPVITLWNPYNVDITVGASQMCYLFSGFPTEHRIYVNGIYRTTFNWRVRDVGGNFSGNVGSGIEPVITNALVLRAGEAKMLTALSYKWETEANIMHHRHEMYAVPFVYSPAKPGSAWGTNKHGDGNLTGIKGVATDVVKVETKETFNVSYRDIDLHTYEMRAQANTSARNANWATFLWMQAMGWKHTAATPTIALPYKESINQPSATFAEIYNAPKPFMVIDMQLKALDEEVLPGKIWRDSIPNQAFQGISSNAADVTPYFASAFKLKFSNINSYQEAASYLQVAPDNPIHTYFGGSHFPAAGQSFITDRELPMSPFTSLAQLQHLSQNSVDALYASGFYLQNRAIGNSFATPGVPSDKVKTDGWPFVVNRYFCRQTGGGDIFGWKPAAGTFIPTQNIDRSYAANHLLWDDYFFSSIAAKSDMLRGADEWKSVVQVASEFFEQGTPLPNERYKPWLDQPVEDVLGNLVDSNQPTPTAYQDVAANLMVDGAFNINSTSVTAWKTMLAAAHRKNIVTMEGGGAPAANGGRNYVVSRFSMPNGPPVREYDEGISNKNWQGYHELSEEQIVELAEAIVRQVKQRGPFRSLAEFINRRLGPESDPRTQFGALQAALEDPEVSINAALRTPAISEADIALAGYQNKTAALGPRYQSAPSYVTQADLLNAMGPVLSARSDTFVVRGYGEACDADGKVVARAWCEGVVRRVPVYLDPVDMAYAPPTTLVNTLLGRRVNLVSFRWLNEKEL